MKNKKSLVKTYKNGGKKMPSKLPSVYNFYYGVPQYADGGKNERIWKDIGAGAYGVGEGLLDTMTMGATDQLTDIGYKALQKAGNSTEDEIREQNSIAGYGKAAGAITGAVTGLVTPEAAIGAASKGIGQGISYGSADDPNAQMAGQAVGSLGQLASMGMGLAGGLGAETGAEGVTMASPSTTTGVPNTMSPQQVGMLARYGGMKYKLGGVIKTPYDNKIAITDIRMFKDGGLSSGMQRVWDNPNKKPLFVNSLQMFKNGGQIVAELEGGENYIKADNGGFVQLPDSAPSHEEGGVKLTEQQIPTGSIIFSDKLKVPGTNKTFAQVNKKNDTSKLDKKFDNIPDNQAARNAKEELRKAMMINSQNLFAQQEALKQQKVNNYAKRLGLVPSRDNETTEPMGLPESNEGEYAMARMGGMYMAGGQMMVPTVNDYMRNEDYNSLTYANGGRLPEGILRSRLEAHMSPEEANNYIANYGNGGMIKRADGTYSKRGLWDNIRANAGSGKEPTKEMLEQEAKINAEYRAGGIHINPANKGKFTASAERAGMGVQEFARHVLANKEDYSSTQVKRANFARNAAGWKHEMGGVQQYNMGGKTNLPPYQPLSKTDSINVSRLINMPKYDLNKFNFEVERIYDKNGKEVDANIYRTNLKTGKTELENESWKTNPLHHKTLNEVIARQNIAKGQNLNATPQFYETYEKSLNYMPEVSKTKRYGGINYNNESIIQYTIGGVNGEDPNNPNPGAVMTDEYGQQILSNSYYNNPENIAMSYARVNQPEVMQQKNWALGTSPIMNDLREPTDLSIKEVPTSIESGSTKSAPKDYSKLINAGTQIGMGLLQNAGNIYDIYRGSKPETETYERYTPTTLTANEILRRNQLGYAKGKEGLAAASQGSGSAYRQNLKDLALKKMYADAKSIEEVNNLNAGIANQAGIFNTELAMRETIANAQNRAAARDLMGSGISGTGKNISSQIKDYRTGSMDQKTLNAIIASNPEWANSAEGKAYIAQFKK